MRRGVSVAVLLVLAVLAMPSSAGAVDPEEAVAGAGASWFSGDLDSQIGENCSVIGSPYTETMVSAVANYGGVKGVPVVGQKYWTSFLVSIPGDPCGPGSSSVETDVVLPPNTEVDGSRPIRCFGQPSGAHTFEELTGKGWSFDGYSGAYCPSAASPSSLHSGGLSFGFRPLATGQLFQIFVPVISSAPLVGAGHSPPDGFYWLTDATGVYANPGLSTVWANVFSAPSSGSPFIYFAHEPATPFWEPKAPEKPFDLRNRVEFNANLYTAQQAGNLCWEIRAVPSGELIEKCTEAEGWNGTVPAGEPDLRQVFGEGAAAGPGGGYVPVAFLPELWNKDFKIVWRFTYGGSKEATAEAPFHTLSGPDSDGDGVPDAADACPSEKGTLADGCMPPAQTDPDGDGVYGASDLCPAVNGMGALNGCPGGIVPPAPESKPAPPTPPKAFVATVRHGHASAVKAGGRILLKTGLTVGCPAGGPACSVRLIATVSGAQAASASGAAHRPLTIGTLHATVAPGRSLALTLRLTPKGAALLKKHHRLKIALSGTASALGGPAVKLAGTVAVPYPKARHH
ncbi:MAG TPA: hypothetical protein VN618_14655 [Solirubrobacteraceae bacterium]|nr:hypothetical protein [Solirubrobacteraceae bacterium]